MKNEFYLINEKVSNADNNSDKLTNNKVGDSSAYENSIKEETYNHVAEEIVVQDGLNEEIFSEKVTEPIISETDIKSELIDNYINGNTEAIEDVAPEFGAITDKIESSENYAADILEPASSELDFGSGHVESVPESTDIKLLDTQSPTEPASVKDSELFTEITAADAEMEAVSIDSVSVNEIVNDANTAAVITDNFTAESNGILMEEGANTQANLTDINAAVSEEIKIVRKGRKPRNITQITTIKSPAKSPAKAAITKRPYTRKIKQPTPVDVGEEVSILSSSESSGSSKESINIMSSSNSDESIHSLPSVDSSSSAKSTRSARSVKSTSTKSEDSTKSFKSNNSGNSTVTIRSTTSKKSFSSDKSISSESSISIASVNSATEISAWEKAACPSIFENMTLKNPENRYKTLKRRLENGLRKKPELLLEDFFKKFADFNVKSIEQVYKIVKNGDMAEEADATPNKKAAKAGKPQEYEEIETKNSNSEDLEFLKKMTMTSSGRKRKIRSEEGDWIDPNEIEGRVISHEPAQAVKEKRKRRNVKKVSEDEDLNTTEDPFRLILLHEFDEQNKAVLSGQVDENGDEFELVKAPFRVEICNSVILLMDLHSHLHSSEIIGLLGGNFIKVEDGLPVLRINYVFPCSTAHSTGTQVDVDPLSEMEAGDYFESNGVRMAGWYHSHPNFEPNPSLRDLETQTMYQGLFKNSEPDSNIEPFVGLIINPYMAVTESSSHIECFYVVPTIDPTQEPLPYRLPIEGTPFDPQNFPQILQKMREIVSKAENSDDRLDMRKNAQPGLKRIEKLFNSLQSHGNLSEDQMEEIKILFI